MAVRVKLMNEYSIDWPLWLLGGPAQEGQLPISEPLARELKAWARSFNDHYHWESGWDDGERARAHAATAAPLLRALQAELGTDYEVTMDLWEVPGG